MKVRHLPVTLVCLLFAASGGISVLAACKGSYKGAGGEGSEDSGPGLGSDSSFKGAEGLPPGACNGDDPNECGTCSSGCTTLGKSGGFPTSSNDDPNVQDASGVTKDKDGNLTLGVTADDFNYMWIANTFDNAGSACASAKPSNPARCRGTISKIDTTANKEVARYFTTTCKSQSGASGCVDVNGKTITANYNHTPSRTAVDYNFDVWVANRAAYGGQPSVTKIANDPSDCIDRNNNDKIDTSKDHDGDGKINIDCDGDGIPDNASTKCSNGKPPEFLGDDDECVLFTVNYGDPGDVGRSVCLSAGKATIGASNAWVGTYHRPEHNRGKNRYYKLNGYNGKIEKEIELPTGHHSYGCMADQYDTIWSTDLGVTTGEQPSTVKTPWMGSLAYFKASEPYTVGVLLRGGPNKGANTTTYWKAPNGGYLHYGITLDDKGDVWLGGYSSAWVLRYKPDRSSFAGLAQGTWTRIDGKAGTYTRGIAADNRGKIWVGVHDNLAKGYVWRLDQSISSGVHAYTGKTWPVTATEVVGVGVDIKGNVWAIGKNNHTASRLDVDAKGEVTNAAKANVKVGMFPYTYSDFTGYGLKNFVRPSGRYVYQLKPCPDGSKALWEQVSWQAKTPTNTQVTLRVRAGDSEATFGGWSAAYTQPPAMISGVSPNPSYLLQIELTLTSLDGVYSPTLYDVAVSYTCGPGTID